MKARVEVSCCIAEAEHLPCAAVGPKAPTHDKNKCENTSCCTEITVVVEQSITELLLNSSQTLFTPIAAIVPTVASQWASMVPKTELSALLEGTKPPDRGKPIRIWISCFRC